MYRSSPSSASFSSVQIWLKLVNFEAAREIISQCYTAPLGEEWNFIFFPYAD